ncbi:Hypothetical predicted protein [Xyrichtys novacula]|uniref:Uncharacterized protein n=1 Tax=Xyrichtys novacula TaxID=13765 RepID=A0AAV1GWA0_XYRNO|nr:Hypothetical predicted protein [Xyrichtys novacula]
MLTVKTKEKTGLYLQVNRYWTRLSGQSKLRVSMPVTRRFRPRFLGLCSDDSLCSFSIRNNSSHLDLNNNRATPPTEPPTHSPPLRQVCQDEGATSANAAKIKACTVTFRLKSPTFAGKRI